MFGQQTTSGANKQICSYYLKGTCKYGAKCWYYHPPNKGGGSGMFGGTSSVFAGSSTTQQDSKEFVDFVKQVSGEMTQWERSGQWLPSSFTPLKGHPLLVGFTDTSPEEFRVEAYQALKSNTYASYQAQWAEVQQRFRQLREALKVSTPEAVQALRDVFYNKSPLEQQNQQQQVLKQPTGLFGKPTGSVFVGASSSSSSSGAGGTGLLGAKPQGSLFGSSAPSIFGGGTQGSSTPSVFGGASASKPLFGAQPSLFGNAGGAVFGAPAPGTTGVFGAAAGQPQASTQGSLFGAASGALPTTSSVFGAAGTTQKPAPAPAPGTQSSIFSQQATQQLSGVFGGQQQPAAQQGGLFGAAQPQQSQQQTGLFAAQPQQQTAGLFGSQQQQQQQQQSQQQQIGLFGAQPQTGSTFAMPSVLSGTQTTNQPQGTTAPIFGGAPFGGAQQGGKGLFGGSTGMGEGGGFKPGLFSSGGGGEANPKPGLFGKPAEPTPGLFGEGGQPPPAQAVSLQAGNNYTPLDQLQPEDRVQFEAEAFTFVPLCPPPLELCT